MEKYKRRPYYHEHIFDLYPERRNDHMPNITFVVTEECPLRCTYCYETSKNPEAKMTEEVARKGVDFILSDARYKNTAGAVIDFIGGEPFCNVGIMDYIANYLRFKLFRMDHPWKHTHRFSISTNGVLYFNDDVQRFLQKNAKQISLTVTVDGNKELHDACRVYPDGRGSFDDALRAADHAMRNYGADSTKLTVCPENLPYLFDAVKEFFRLGYKMIHFNPAYEPEYTLEQGRSYYQQIVRLADYAITYGLHEKTDMSIFSRNIGAELDAADDVNYCGGTGKMLAIGADGRLYPCLRYMSQALNHQPALCIGDVWNGVTNTHALCELEQITRTSQSPEKCRSCKAASGCGWCSALNYDLFGTANKRHTGICWMHKARVLANAHYWEKLGEPYTLNLCEEDIAALKGE